MMASQTRRRGRGRTGRETLVGLVLIDMEEGSGVGVGLSPARVSFLEETGQLQARPNDCQRLSQLAEFMIRVASAAITSASGPVAVSSRSCLSWIINRRRIA
jgi:hypothetical protein